MFLRRVYTLAILSLLYVIPVSSQTVGISGIINIYTPVVQFYPCSNAFEVGSTAGFAVGDTVLLIQMQGAVINQSNSASYGTVTDYNSAGLYEKGVIQSITANDIYFTKDLVNSYDVNGHVQMISIPQYVNANTSGTLTCQAWNGSTGGVLIFEASGTVNISGAPINVSNLGFRGGDNTEACPNGCNFFQSHSNYFYTDSDYRSARKGEGIAEIATGFERGRGAQANGGGGGNDHNSGGGGGGNFVAGGQGSRNNEPGSFNCDGNSPGVGGRNLTYPGNQLFMGGGGGAGHGNNSSGSGCNGGGGSSAGGAGGGIVFIRANTLTTSVAGRFISSDGRNAVTGNFDGAGGGGSGGTIVLDVQNFGATRIDLFARGGNGGNTSSGFQNRCYGPGGGGAGGQIVTGASPIPGGYTVDLSGGDAGIIQLSSNGCANTNGTATDGANGTTLTNFSFPFGTLDPPAPCILPVSFLNFKGYQDRDGVQLEWVTSYEINNHFFEVERSRDGETFTAFERVDGKGNTEEESYYSSIDVMPFQGVNYYRLRQVDFDGTSAYSPTIEVYTDRGAQVLTSVYPNPVPRGQQLSVDVSLGYEQTVTLEVINPVGKQVHYQSSALSAGDHHFEIPTQQLAAGIYFVRLRSQRGTEVRRLVINP